LPSSHPISSAQHHTLPSSQDIDWSREQCSLFSWRPGHKLLKSIRDYQKYRSGDIFTPIFKTVCVLRHRFWSAVSGADIPINATIGGGLLIPHPNGVVIHPKAEIGINCLIMTQVVIGMSDDAGLPTIGNAVDIGAGAKILGSINIGSRSRIGANAVVISDVPPGATAVGIPAKIVTSKG